MPSGFRRYAASSDASRLGRPVNDGISIGTSCLTVNVTAAPSWIKSRSLAEPKLDEGNVDAAAALIEAIRPYAGTEHDFARLEAMLARAVGDTARATAVLTELRARAGEAWTADDEKTLAALAGR